MEKSQRTSDQIPAQAGIVGVLLAAFLIMVFCVWNYWYLILETNDRIPEDLEPFIPQTADTRKFEREIRVGVYDSAATRQFYRQMKFDYSSVLQSWEVFLKHLGLGYREFNQIDELDRFEILILPFTTCLSNYEAQRIKDFVASGGRLFMTGTVGARFEDGSWRDQPVFGDVVGARFVGNANPSPQGAARLNLNRDLPVSLRWTPRRSLVIPSYNEVLVIRPIGHRMKVVAKAPFYRSEDSYDDLVAICYGSYLEGKVAWSGVRIGAVPSGDETAERAFRELFSNMMVWLADRPRVTTPTWPGNREAALGLIVRAEGKSPLRLFSAIKKMNRKVAVLATPGQLKDFSEIPGFRELQVEWILLLDGEYTKLIREKEEDFGLGATKVGVEHLTGIEIRGVMVPQMRTRKVAQAALRAGFSYLLAPPTDGIDEYPEIYASVREMGPLEAPKVLSLAPYRTHLPERFSPTDCVFVLLESSEFLELEMPLHFQGVKDQDDLWFGYPYEIVDWRSDRNSVVMNQEFLPDHRLRLRISNGSYSEFLNFPVTIGFGESVEEELVWPKAVGQDAPELLSKTNGQWSYAIDRFRPGMTLEYIFTPVTEKSK